ncbi:thiamine phosphate synthase [Thermoflexus sp.]|uniref:thiamine phosphate synthase n=1 Tax=Thermoflexus sp. TaxID=1969742 RepID=UPI0035E447C8
MGPDLRVYLVLDPDLTLGRPPLEIAEAALRGGITMLQLRWKSGPLREMLQLGEALQKLCQRYGVPFLINDRVDVALALRADGVHLGQEDLPPEVARRLLGPRALIGVSARTPDQARAAEAAGADYLGTGSVFPTSSKANPILIGLEGLAVVVRSTRLPVVAIGGVSPENAAACIRAGAVGVAVISAITQAPDPEAAARALRQAVDQALAGNDRQ